MDWHLTHRSQDGKWRIPADSPAWQHIDSTWPEFRDELRYLRLGLGTYGVNPFGLRSSSYSIWPVMLVNYNLPPHMAIKKGHIMLSLLIPGKCGKYGCVLDTTSGRVADTMPIVCSTSEQFLCGQCMTTLGSGGVQVDP
jgi:hypothetical protein